jgi:hypothetical protein
VDALASVRRGRFTGAFRNERVAARPGRTSAMLGGRRPMLGGGQRMECMVAERPTATVLHDEPHERGLTSGAL